MVLHFTVAAQIAPRWDIEYTDSELVAIRRIQVAWRAKKLRRALELRTRHQRNPTGRVRLLRMQLHVVLEDPSSSPSAQVLHLVIFVSIVLALVALVVETMPEASASVEAGVWWYVDAVCSSIFTVEYLLRLAVCNVHGHRLSRWLVQPLNLADVAAIVPFYVSLIVGQSSGAAVVRVLRALRLVRLMRVFKLGRYSAGLRIMSEAMSQSVQPLWVLVFFVFIGVVLFGSLVYYAERIECPVLTGEENTADVEAYNSACLHSVTHFIKETSGLKITGLCCDLDGDTPISHEFPTIVKSFWWAVVTMSTAGFGDKVTRTWEGQIVATIAMLSGILLIALPVAIVGRKFQEVHSNADNADAKTAALRRYHPPAEGRLQDVTLWLKRLKFYARTDQRAQFHLQTLDPPDDAEAHAHLKRKLRVNKYGMQRGDTPQDATARKAAQLLQAPAQAVSRLGRFQKSITSLAFRESPAHSPSEADFCELDDRRHDLADQIIAQLEDLDEHQKAAHWLEFLAERQLTELMNSSQRLLQRYCDIHRI